MVSITMSIAVLAAFALFGGGLWLVARRRDRRKGMLMLLAAAVLLANVVLWTAPLPGG